jgi:hypothetical protein
VIYIVTCRTKDTKFAKIGYSKNPERRIKELQYMCPLKLKLFCIIPGTEKSEKILHRFFENNKVAHTNEWFIISKDLNDCIKYWQSKDKPPSSIQDLLFCRSRKQALARLRSLYPDTYESLFNT